MWRRRDRRRALGVCRAGSACLVSIRRSTTPTRTAYLAASVSMDRAPRKQVVLFVKAESMDRARVRHPVRRVGPVSIRLEKILRALRASLVESIMTTWHRRRANPAHQGVLLLPREAWGNVRYAVQGDMYHSQVNRHALVAMLELSLIHI